MAIVDVPAIRDLGTVPNNNMDEAAFNQAAESFTTKMPGWGGDVKAVGDATKTNAEHVEALLPLIQDAQRLTELARDTVMGVANFKGDWVNLSGPLARPATVQHNNSVWLLMRDVANVAAEQPGVSSAWVNQTARVASVNGQGGDVLINWGNLPGVPTTANGWLTDVLLKVDYSWANLPGKPTTVSAAGLTNAVTTDTAQTITGQKTFEKAVAVSTTQGALSSGRSFSATLNTTDTKWFTLCRLPDSNSRKYVRFLLSSNNYYLAEITFGRSVHGQTGASMQYKLMGNFSFWHAHPWKFRIVAVGNDDYRLEFCFPGTSATTSLVEITVLEEFGNTGAANISFPLTVAASAAGAAANNTVTVGGASNLTALEASLHLGASYYAIVDGSGSVGQAATESNVGTTG